MTSASTIVENTKSKRACLYCEQKKLITTDDNDDFVYYHCLNCGGEFPESDKQKEYREGKDTDDRYDSPLNGGAVLLMLMLITILVINVSDRRTLNNPIETPNWVETLFDWID